MASLVGRALDIASREKITRRKYNMLLLEYVKSLISGNENLTFAGCAKIKIENIQVEQVY
jgi:hypothetical protein